MDWKRLDRARRTAGPVQVDLVEAYAQGRVSRRDFVRRGLVIGLSMPFMSSVIAACGSSGGGSSSATTAGATATTAAAGGSAAPGTTAAAAGSTVAGKAGGTMKIAAQKPVSVDPVAMQDLGGYGIVAQVFEFLVTLGEKGAIAPGLAESWTPNTDGSVWTFKLRQNVKWHDGTPFTSKDVAATMDRLVEGGNSGLKGVIEKGAVDTSDPNTAVFNLASPNGNLPYLVSVFNAQTVITPVNYPLGTTLDKNSNGTGPWKLASYDPSTGAKFTANADWWGGKPALDGTEFQFFEDLGTMVTAMQGNSVDAIVQFSVIGGQALLTSPDFNVLQVQASTHRQIWMRCDKGQFAKKEVRQALAYTFNREQMVQTLFDGKGEVANDYPVAPFMPMYAEGVPQRQRDVAKAKQLLSQAGVTNLKATLHAVDLQEIPELAQLIQSGAKEAGIDLTLAVESDSTFYGAQWCPKTPANPPCSGAAELGIVDYGHRPVPDVFLNAALATNGVWNSSQYSSPAFDAAFKEYQAAVDVNAQKTAMKKIETILNEDVPIGVPYFYDYLSGNSKKFQNVRVSALGQMFLEKASQV
jgi:peptide/nickel transport system substrate-binding protein